MEIDYQPGGVSTAERGKVRLQPGCLLAARRVVHIAAQVDDVSSCAVATLTGALLLRLHSCRFTRLLL